MATIQYTDRIFATVTRRGRTIATLAFSGMTSLAEIIAHIKSVLKGTVGMLNVSLRNSTQGWSQERSVILTPSVRLSA